MLVKDDLKTNFHYMCKRSKIEGSEEEKLFNIWYTDDKLKYYEDILDKKGYVLEKCYIDDKYIGVFIMAPGFVAC